VKIAVLVALAGASVLAISACAPGGANSDPSSAGVAISGTLGTGTVSMMGDINRDSENELRMQEGTFSISNYGVRCVTLASTPTAADGQCDSSGKFSLNLPGATGVPVGCFVISGSGSSANVIATLAFQGTSTDINGNTSRAGSYVPGSGTSGLTLGAVTLDLNKGLAVVPTAQIAGSTGPTAPTNTFTNMTGAWLIHAMSTVPTGYRTAGTAGGNDGPQDGQTIYLGYYSALNGGEDHHGLSIWNSAADLTACNGEGATLPGGWSLNPNSSPNNKLTTAVNISTTIPGPTGIPVSCYNGQNFVDLVSTVCASANAGNNWQSSTMCSAILTDPAISNGTVWASTSCSAGSGCTPNSVHWGMAPVQAAFLCTLNNIRSASGSCGGDVSIDWGNLWSSANSSAISSVGYSAGSFTGLPAADTSHNDAVSYFNGAIRFKKSPRNRFLFGEFYLNGNLGSLTDHHDYLDNACAGTKGSNGSCQSADMRVCHVSENNKLTITQTDATHATVELVQVGTVSPTDDIACSTDTRLAGKLLQSKYLFTISK
jgi:hypothetical protein